MVDPIRRFAPAPWTHTPALDGAPEPRRRAATSTRATPAPAPDPPELPDVNAALLARAARAAAAPGQPRVGAARADVSTVLTDPETPVQQRLEAFFDRARPVYRVPVGDNQVVALVVATPFRMAMKITADPHTTDETTLRFLALDKRVRSHDAELRAVANRLGIHDVDRIKVGRGTLGEVQALTQALLDRHKLPPPEAGEPLDLRVRRMMCDYGIGFDCAGYVQQAFLAAHSVTRQAAGFRPNILDEDLSGLSRRRFAPVAPEESRAGDIISLGPPPGDTTGHRVVVLDAHGASAVELRRYCGSGEGAALARGRVTVLTVASSFGSSAYPGRGGVERQTWLYDADSTRWGRVLPARVENHTYDRERVMVRAMPYDGHHPLIGVYHYPAKH